MAFSLESSSKETFVGEFLVPDYYKNFSCKGDKCRNTCCHGWKVTISSKEYFILHGLSCSKKLREKIDRTFIPLLNPTKERYAEISHNYKGDCPLLLDDGYCSLHKECTENVLPSVCRYYPRGPHIDYALESSCTNSCERTLELLFDSLNPISFELRKQTFKMNFQPQTIQNVKKELYQKVRLSCFKILSDRNMSLPDRIQKVGMILFSLDEDTNQAVDSIDCSIVSITKDIKTTYEVLLSISDWFIEYFPNLAPFFETVKSQYQNANVIEEYLNTLEHFNTIFPMNEIYYEKMLINNLFFRQFPFQEYTKSFKEEFYALCGKYIVIRFLGINLMKTKDSLEDFIDIMSKIFRVIAHTKFEKTIIELLKKQQVTNFKDYLVLIQG